MPIKSLYLLIVYFLVIPCSFSAVVDNLYEYEVLVSDQSAEQRRLGVRNALSGTLVKITGDRLIVNHSAVIDMLNQADQYVQQYEYRNRPSADPQDQANKPLYLWVRFNEQAVETVLHNNNITLWGKERPATLVWLAYENQSEQKLIAPETFPELIEQLDYAARQRGIKLIYPLLDIEDTLQVKSGDIARGNTDSTFAASARYQPDAVWVGYIKQDENRLTAQWASRIKNLVTHWSVQKESLGGVVEESVNIFADKLAQNYIQAATHGYASSFDILVEDIGSYERYVKVRNYLTTLNAVTSVLVKQATPDQMTFTISAQGGELALAQTIELGNILAPTGVRNTYRLLPR